MKCAQAVAPSINSKQDLVRFSQTLAQAVSDIGRARSLGLTPEDLENLAESFRDEIFAAASRQ